MRIPFLSFKYSFTSRIIAASLLEELLQPLKMSSVTCLFTRCCFRFSLYFPTLCCFLIVCLFSQLNGPGWLSRYSDSLRAGRSGALIPVVAKFFVPFQNDPGTHPASCRMGVPSLSREKSERGVALTTHPHLAPRLKKQYSHISTRPLGLHGLFYGEIYFYIDTFILLSLSVFLPIYLSLSLYLSACLSTVYLYLPFYTVVTFYPLHAQENTNLVKIKGICLTRI